jgi:glycine/D-amino acid oxidase-like deaminating enzyme
VQQPFDPVLAALYRDSVELYRGLAEARDTGFEWPSEPAGLLLVIGDDEGARRIAGSIATTHAELQPTHLGPGEVTALEPAIARDVAACRLSIGYPIGPRRATAAWAAFAARSGVQLVVGSEARPILAGDRVRGVALDDGRKIAAPDVVVAAGPWTPAIVDPGGRWQPIRPVWGVVVDVRLTAPPRHVLEEAEIEIEPGDDTPSSSEPVSFSLVTADGASSVGSTFLDQEPDPADLVPAILRRGARFVPAVASSAVGAHRVCARPQSRDGRPLVGRVPWIDGLWVAAGHGPWGISTGPATGKLLAELVGGVRAAPPAALDAGRFGSPGR